MATQEVDEPAGRGPGKPLCDHDGFADRIVIKVLSRAKDGKRICVSMTAKEKGVKSLTVHLVQDTTGKYWIDRTGNALAQVGSI